jgi:Protein of unknown function (DUF1353)
VTFTPSNREIELRAIPPNRFRLLTGFTYKDPEGRDHKITPRGVGNTDLASVPWFLWWFVASYGRHTAAALAHDQLVDKIDRRYADWVFRCALKESGTSWIRRWLMGGGQFRDEFSHRIQAEGLDSKVSGQARTTYRPLGHHRRVLTRLRSTRSWDRPRCWLVEADDLVPRQHLARVFVLAGGRRGAHPRLVPNVRERGILLIVGIILLAWAMLGVLVTAIVIWGGVPGRLPATRDFAVSVAVSETVW